MSGFISGIKSLFTGPPKPKRAIAPPPPPAPVESPVKNLEDSAEVKKNKQEEAVALQKKNEKNVGFFVLRTRQQSSGGALAANADSAVIKRSTLGAK